MRQHTLEFPKVQMRAAQECVEQFEINHRQQISEDKCEGNADDDHAKRQTALARRAIVSGRLNRRFGRGDEW